MKTILFEKILFSVRAEDAVTVMSIHGHEGDLSITLSPSEFDVFMAECVNHRVLVREAVDEIKVRKALRKEKMKTS